MRGQELYELFAKNAKQSGARPANDKDIVRHADSAIVCWYMLSEEAKVAWERTATQLNEIGGQRMQNFDSGRVLLPVDNDWCNRDDGRNPTTSMTIKA